MTYIATTRLSEWTHSKECLLSYNFDIASKSWELSKSNLKGNHGGMDVLKQGLIKRIGNGTSTDVWVENRIPRDEMMRPYRSKLLNPPAMASYFIDSTSATWDRYKIEEVFLLIDIPAILAIPLCTRNINDF